MYCPWLHKWIDRLSNINWLWLLAPQRIVVVCFIITLIGVGFEYGPSLPGCGGPISPLPTPTARPTAVPATPTVPATATPGPTPTMPESPVSPLETPGAGW